MAQVDTSTVTKLRMAILNICKYPRGHRHLSDIFRNMMPNLIDLEEGKEFFEIVFDLIDECIFNSANKSFDSEEPFQLEDILFSGSFSEGTQKINFKTNSMSDVDCMLILKNIKVTEEDQKSGNLTVKEDTPFANWYLKDDDLIEKWADFLEASSNTRCERSVRLSSIKLKNRFRENYINYGPMFTPLVKEDVGKIDEGPSVAVRSKLPGEVEVNDQLPMGSFPVEDADFVLAIKCDGWPLCAQEWSSRSRCWPSQDIVQKIIEGGFHIVCKSSLEGDFRLSYSVAEILLIQNVSDLQHKTYRAFKSFVSHYKNGWSSNVKKIFCSYHLKTIFLWYCEKSHPRDWTEERIVGHLLSLIDDLISALKERNLPMYFMPKYNLMEQMEDGTEVVEKIAELRFNIHLITEAIIAEETNFLQWFNFLSPVFSPLLEKVIEKGKFEQSDIFECLQNLMNDLDDFCIKVAGKTPTRDEERGRRAVNIAFGPFMKYINKLCECENLVDVNRPLKKEDD